MPTGQILLVFAVVFGVVVGAFWLFVQRPEQKSTAALRRRIKGETEDVDEHAGDALIERQPKHDRRRLEGIAATAGGGVLRYLGVQIERANMDMPPERLLGMAVAVGVAGAFLLGLAVAAVGGHGAARPRRGVAADRLRPLPRRAPGAQVRGAVPRGDRADRPRPAGRPRDDDRPGAGRRGAARSGRRRVPPGLRPPELRHVDAGRAPALRPARAAARRPLLRHRRA